MAADRLPEELLRRIRDDEAFRRALLDVLLGEEFLRLPTEVRRLEEAIERLTAAVDRGYREMEQRVEALTARMERVEAQIEALTAAQRETTEQIRALAERMERVETQIEALTARMERAEAQIEALARGMDQMTEEMRLVRQRVDHSVGLTLELRYQMRARAILGRFLRQIRAGTVGDVGDLVVARLSESDAEEVFATDLLIRGVSRTKPEVGEIWIAVEVSAVIDRYDVERAVRRASVLRTVHPVVVPAVAGERITEGAEQLAAGEGVLLIRDGVVTGWDWVVVPRLDRGRADRGSSNG